MLVLHHAPFTRSSTALAALEEVGAPFDLRVLDLRAGEGRTAAHLALNPLGKVPVLEDGCVVVTELVAILLHLADRFPGAGLAPAVGEAARGPYLRWMLFYAGSFEPALMDAAAGRAPGPAGMVPYGTQAEVMEAVRAHLAAGPFILGERFSMADILWGLALDWGLHGRLVPRLPEFEAHAARVLERPAVRRGRRRDALLAAQQRKAGSA